MKFKQLSIIMAVLLLTHVSIFAENEINTLQNSDTLYTTLPLVHAFYSEGSTKKITPIVTDSLIIPIYSPTAISNDSITSSIGEEFYSGNKIDSNTIKGELFLTNSDDSLNVSAILSHAYYSVSDTNDRDSQLPLDFVMPTYTSQLIKTDISTLKINGDFHTTPGLDSTKIIGTFQMTPDSSILANKIDVKSDVIASQIIVYPNPIIDTMNIYSESFENLYLLNKDGNRVAEISTKKVFVGNNETGAYSVVRIEQDSIIDKQNIYIINTTTTSTKAEEQINNHSIVFYPNPVTSFITIEKFYNKNISIVGINGNIIITIKNRKTDLSSLNTGLYYLIDSKNRKIIGRFYKK